MAIVDEISGYSGYTTAGPDSVEDENGHVRKCIVAIEYPAQPNDVDFSITNGDDDWAIKVGNGDIIPISNPSVIYVNKDNSIIQFDMKEGYPSNSPCVLVYHSDTAKFNVKQRTTSRPFEVNSVSGHFATTVEGYGGTPGGDGLVNRLIASIPFPQMLNAVKFEISNDPSHWGARMGDGTIINLRDPQVIATNVENAVVLFTMDSYYPSNSRCILVYRSMGASISVKPTEEDNTFYSISDIIDIPDNTISGMTIDLNSHTILPFNASCQEVSWNVLSGPGEILNKHYLYATGGGEIRVRAISANGLGDNNPYEKIFTVTSEQNKITIDAQPVSEISAVMYKIDSTISVVAKSVTEEINYQWYYNTVGAYDGATKVEGETQPEFRIPATLRNGHFYYFCELTSDGAYDVRTSICHVYVAVECVGIGIFPRISEIELDTSRQLHAEQAPADSDLPEIVWSSSNSDVVSVDDDGTIRSNLITDTKVTITAKSVDGKLSDSIEIMTKGFKPVVDITNIKTEIGMGDEYDLSPVIKPADATYNEVYWTLDNAGTTGATLRGNRLSAVAEGSITIHATIEKGFSLKSAYKKYFVIRVVNRKFIPVTNINIVNDTSKVYCVDEVVAMNCLVSPLNASSTSITYSVESGPGVLVSNLLSFTGQGNVIVRATVANGSGAGMNYSKIFSFTCSGKESPKQLVETVVPVSDITVQFIHESDAGVITVDDYYDPYESGETPVDIPYIIKPAFATHQGTITTTVKSISSKRKPDNVSNGKTNILPVDFWDSGWKNESTSLVTCDRVNNQISCDPSVLEVSTIYQVVLHVTVKDGVAEGTNFEKDVTVKMSTQSLPLFVPLTDFDINLPTPLRTYYPIFPMSLTFNPKNATVRNDVNLDTVHFEVEIPKDEQTTGAVRYQPAYYDMYHTVEPLEIFEWNRSTLYMYPYNPGVIKMKVIIENATVENINKFNPFNPDKTYLVKKFEIPVLPPFIPVKDIKNIPDEMPLNASTFLSPIVSTDGGLNCYNPCWDEEQATNTEITWEIIDPENIGVTLTSTNGISVTIPNSSDPDVVGKTFTLRATIPEGTQEHLVWYDKENDAIDYTQDFTITITEAEEATTSEIVKVYYGSTNKTVSIYRKSDFSALFENESGTIQLFNKKTNSKVAVDRTKITRVVFNEDGFIEAGITSLRNFGNGFTGLTYINDIPSTITGNNCLENFLMGCTSFNQEVVIPNTVNGECALKYFLRDCTSFNKPVTLPDNLTGDGCLHGFLAGCTSFNQEIIIPNTVTGNNCLENFLMGCTSFNQEVVIPSGVSGYACMRAFLRKCSSFNQPLTLPDNVGKYVSGGYIVGRQLCNMLEGADAMCSDITVPLETGKNAQLSERTFASFSLTSANITNGILITGDGANDIIKRLSNTYEPDENGYYAYPPYVHIKNLDD